MSVSTLWYIEHKNIICYFKNNLHFTSSFWNEIQTMSSTTEKFQSVFWTMDNPFLGSGGTSFVFRGSKEEYWKNCFKKSILKKINTEVDVLFFFNSFELILLALSLFQKKFLEDQNFFEGAIIFSSLPLFHHCFLENQKNIYFNFYN